MLVDDELRLANGLSSSSSSSASAHLSEVDLTRGGSAEVGSAKAGLVEAV